MKLNTHTIITAVIFLAIGLIAGYFMFKNKSVQHIPDLVGEHQHDTKEDREETIYTCSMHPQIRQNEPGICPICEMDLIPLGSMTSDDPLVLQMTEEAVKLAEVQTTTIGQVAGPEGKKIRLSGKIQADERLASSLVAHIPGRIEQLFITFEGEQVTKGQKIASIYSPELIAAQKELIEAQKLKDVSPGLEEAAKNKLQYWKISAEQIDQIIKSDTIQETFAIFAEQSGVVSKRKVAVGDYIKQGEILFDIINLRKVWVLFDAYERDLGNISIGDKITFSSPSLPGKSLDARVTFIDPVIDPTTRTAAIRTEVRNTSGRLKPGMFVSGTLIKTPKGKTKLTVPKTAVLWTGKRSVVYVKVPDTEIPSYQFREVQLGEPLGDSYILSNGLEAEEAVVTNGAFSIDAAAQLNNQASMMNHSISIKKSGPEKLPDFRNETPQEFKEQFQKVIESYLELKDALVSTDNEKSVSTTKNMINHLTAINLNPLSSDIFIYWKSKQQILEKHGKLLINANDIKVQRRQFQFLSDALIESLKVFGFTGQTMYIQYCPMAIENKGAEWISGEPEILNPYFGDKMLKCGSVKSKIE